MRTLGFVGALSVGVVAALVGCSNAFTLGDGGLTTASTTGGDGGAGGGMTTSSAGGSSPCAEECADVGEFCASDGQCKSCSDFSEPLTFTAPTAINVSPGDMPGFPRVRDSQGGQQMVFAALRGSGNQDIAMSTSTNHGPWSAGTWLGSFINTATNETGPLRLPLGVGLSEVPSVGDKDVLLFTAVDTSGKRKIYASNGGAKSPLYTVNDGTEESYSIAMAHGLTPPRYWYMNRHLVGSISNTDFRTKLSTGTDAQAITSLTLPGGCPVDMVSTPDLAPWVTAAGNLLLFNAGYTTVANCSGVLLSRIFYVRLTVSTGQPVGEVEEPQIDTLPSTASIRTPSLSPDSCTLYFSSSDSEQGVPRLYSARRR